MTYLVFPPDGPMREKHTGSLASLSRLQGWVGGDIEDVYHQDPFDSTIVCIVNENGHNEGMPPTRYFPRLRGPVVICRQQGEDLVGVHPKTVRIYRMIAVLMERASA